MTVRWSWVTLAACVVAGFLGCGESKAPSDGPKAPKAGTSSVAAGGSDSEGGEGGIGTGGGNAGRAGRGTGGASGGRAGNGSAGASGGSQASGGSGGTGASGGSAGQASGGTSGVMGGSTGGSGGNVPAGWNCGDVSYDDGQSCDCGCGVLDPDCEDESVESCDVCSQFGSCSNGSCPSSIDPDDNSQCALPPLWVCTEFYYGDGTCDCGCGDIDLDCESRDGDACERCPLFGCAQNFCATVDPEDNALCTTAPRTWTCEERLYRDGSVCHCGCGFRDPDCAENGVEACGECNAEGSCSGQACPGIIDPDAIESCRQPSAPPDWTCDDYQYGDGQYCDCGCGVQDADCRTNTPDACENCACATRCPDSIDPEDPTQCAPAPPGWTCPPETYANRWCDCGCGVIDVDCVGDEAYHCESCDDGCAHGVCNRLDPEDNSQCDFEVPEDWTCSPDVYADLVCDCGCGALDDDCADANESSCDFCNSEGSCSDVICSHPDSPILPNDNTSCSE